MKFPINIKLSYVADEICLPIGTVDSTHYLTCYDDISILTNYVNVFSSYEWRDEELLTAITLSEHSFRTKTEQDPCLHLYVI